MQPCSPCCPDGPGPLTWTSRPRPRTDCPRATDQVHEAAAAERAAAARAAAQQEALDRLALDRLAAAGGTPWWWFAVPVALLTGLITLIGSGREMWNDEYDTVYVTRLSRHDYVHLLHNQDIVHTVYYTLLRLWTESLRRFAAFVPGAFDDRDGHLGRRHHGSRSAPV